MDDRDERLRAAVMAYLNRQAGLERPKGWYHSGRRWYPHPDEKRACCEQVRPPSWRWPYSIFNHCRTALHVAALYEVDSRDVLRAARNEQALAEEWPRLLGVRAWQISLKKEEGYYTPYLVSPSSQNMWETSEFVADATPSIRNENGVYALLVSDPFKTDAELRNIWLRNYLRMPCFELRAAGIVDLCGRVVVHKDGVARAERARILALQIPQAREHHNLFVRFWYSWYSGIYVYDASIEKETPVNVWEEGGAVYVRVSLLEQLLCARYDVPRAQIDLGDVLVHHPKCRILEQAISR